MILIGTGSSIFTNMSPDHCLPGRKIRTRLINGLHPTQLFYESGYRQLRSCPGHQG